MKDQNLVNLRKMIEKDAIKVKERRMVRMEEALKKEEIIILKEEQKIK